MDWNITINQIFLYDLPGVFNFYKMVVTHRLKLRLRKIFAIVAV